MPNAANYGTSKTIINSNLYDNANSSTNSFLENKMTNRLKRENLYILAEGRRERVSLSLYLRPDLHSQLRHLNNH